MDFNTTKYRTLRRSQIKRRNVTKIRLIYSQYATENDKKRCQ